MMMIGSMSLLMLIGLVVLVALIGTGAYLGIRAGRRQVASGEDARAVLNRRLAAGEISPDEYFERESALRSGEWHPSRRRR